MSVVRTVHRAGTAIDSTSVTQADIDAARHRTLLSEEKLTATVASLEFPYIFRDNPQFEFFEFEFQGAHVYSGTASMSFRYMANGSEYSTSNHVYSYSEVYPSTTTGSTISSGTQFELTPSGITANVGFACRLCMQPNNAIPQSHSNAVGGKHPFQGRVSTHYSDNRYFRFTGGGFIPGSGPDEVSGFKIWVTTGFGTNSMFKVFGLNSAATVLV